MSRTGVANLLCKFCFRRFMQPIWLQNHIEKKHPEVWSQRCKSKKRAADESEQDQDHQAKYMRYSLSTFLPNNGSPSYEADDDDGTQPANKAANNPADKPEAAATVQVYPDAGLPCAYVPRPEECARTDGDLYYPFASEEEFNFAEMVIVEKFSVQSIDRMLKDSVGVKDEIKALLKSNYCLRQKVDRMEDGLGASSWWKCHLENILWNAQHAKEPIKFWHRDIIECAKWLLQQPAYEKHLSYVPQKRFEAEGRRVYGEMHTADW